MNQEETMKRKRVIPISQIALASIFAYSFANPLLASNVGLNHRVGFPQRALVVPNEGSLVAQGGMLRERLRERERAKTKAKTKEVEEELEKNPKLVDDPNYLAQHPKLAHYLKRNPEAKRKIEQDPKAFFAAMEN
jgi:hypothetical protein